MTFDEVTAQAERAMQGTSVVAMAKARVDLNDYIAAGCRPAQQHEALEVFGRLSRALDSVKKRSTMHS